MKRRRRVEVTVETDERFVIRRSCALVTVWCSQCAGQVVTQQEAMAVAGVNSRTLHHWAEAGTVHFEETADGLLLICLSSLLEEVY